MRTAQPVAGDRLVRDERECRLSGLEPGEASATGEAFLVLVHPADRGMLMKAGRRVGRVGEGFGGEYRIGRPDGIVPLAPRALRREPRRGRAPRPDDGGQLRRHRAQDG